MPNRNKYKTFKVGIIGCGNIAYIQLKYITKYIKKKSIAICDRNQLRLNFLSKEFGIIDTFTDMEIMLQEFQPEIVHVLTPPHTHKEITVQCLKNGCHVFIEKPMCLTVREAEEIIDEAEKQKRLICIDHIRIYDPLIIKVRGLLHSGEFGQIVNINIDEVDNYLVRRELGLSPNWMTDLPGEILYDLFPHHISLLDEFLPDLRLKAITYQRNENNDLTNIHALFSSSNGTGSIHVSLDTYPLQNSIVFECTKGSISVDFRNFVTILRRKSNLPGAVERVIGSFSISKQLMWGTIKNISRFLRGKLDAYAGMDNAIRIFYDSIGQNRESPIPAQKGLSVTKAIEEIFREVPRPERKDKAMNKLQKADVLVTGGTGFIGRILVERLSTKKGYNVRVLTHRALSDKELSFNGNVEYIKGDISNLKDVENVCQGVKTVYHLAAATKGNWLYNLDTTVTGTQNIVDASIKFGVEHLIYVSTIGLLNATKYPRNDIINEDFPYEENPEKRGLYSNAKLMAERLVLRYIDKLSISVIRPGLVYGPNKDLLSLVGRRLHKSLVLIEGSKNNILPLIYVENLVDALVLAGESKVKGIYNVIDNENITMREFVNIYKELTGEKFFTIYLATPTFKVLFKLADWMLSIFLDKSPSLSYKLKAISRSVRHSAEKIEKIMGWNSKIPFEKGIRESLNSLQSCYYDDMGRGSK